MQVSDEIESIFEKAELAEQNSNQILEFTKEAKNLEQEKNNSYRSFMVNNIFR